MKQIINRKPAFITPKIGQLEGELLKEFARGDCSRAAVSMHRRQDILKHDPATLWTA